MSSCSSINGSVRFSNHFLPVRDSGEFTADEPTIVECICLALALHIRVCSKMFQNLFFHKL